MFWEFMQWVIIYIYVNIIYIFTRSNLTNFSFRQLELQSIFFLSIQINKENWKI